MAIIDCVGWVRRCSMPNLAGIEFAAVKRYLGLSPRGKTPISSAFVRLNLALPELPPEHRGSPTLNGKTDILVAYPASFSSWSVFVN